MKTFSYPMAALLGGLSPCLRAGNIAGTLCNTIR